VAFRIADDLLGIWGDPEVTGKPVHGDLRQGKKTLPILAALGTPYGTELAGLRAARDDMAVRRAAALVTEAGGRATALREAHRHLEAAGALLDSVPSPPRPSAEPRALLAGLTRRTVRRPCLRPAGVRAGGDATSVTSGP
jgi:geranylgeranyl diphosphate synthase, type I